MNAVRPIGKLIEHVRKELAFFKRIRKCSVNHWKMIMNRFWFELERGVGVLFGVLVELR